MQDHSKDNRDERPSGSRKSSGGLFDAYITRINAMKAANGDGNVTNEEVLAAANEVIAEATARRAKERARLDEELRQLEQFPRAAGPQTVRIRKNRNGTSLQERMRNSRTGKTDRTTECPEKSR